ncbi:MAG: hypothetical protein A2W80_09520 [Candidatus Riflebacteria bacterium GWC2_50_8]|nr:MAG: hypothetical protein A2W80_09520 [Candidatus Riflebacteria bacterium GWC2_50_8]
MMDRTVVPHEKRSGKVLEEQRRMTRSELEDATRQWISLWCSPTDWELFDQLHSDDFEDMSSAGREPSKQAFGLGLKQLLGAFPDLATKVEDIIIDELAQRVAVRWSSVGTNKLGFMGIGPTNRRTLITGIEIVEISNGRIRKRWGEWDISAMTEHHT